jgi:hypothetical protein
MRPHEPCLTLDEFVQRHCGDFVELLDGVVVPLVRAGALCGLVGAKMSSVLGRFIEDGGLGVACSHDTFVLIRKDPPPERPAAGARGGLVFLATGSGSRVRCSRGGDRSATGTVR